MSKSNSGDCNSGKYNSGDYNSGHYNSGNRNSGDCNSGKYNSGNRNSGDYNSGYRNSGKYNSGHYNSGNYNSGDCNSGDCNSGDYNSGHYNSGNYNSGDCNSGDCNSGDYNSGHYNSGNYNSGDCNTNEPTVRLFNMDSGWIFNGKDHQKLRDVLRSYQKLKCEWVFEKNMSVKEKDDNKSHLTTGGFLKINNITYNGKTVSEGDRIFLENTPNFDAAILEETTGILLKNTKTITIDGNSFEISLESFDQFKKQFK